jgi:hypothetical protein
MTPDRYALLIALTFITVVGSVLTRRTGGSLDQVRLYFAHDTQEFRDALGNFGPQLLASLRWDFVFLTGYGLLFLTLGWFQRAQGWGIITLVFGVTGAILDVLENQALARLATATTIEANALRSMQILCVCKFLCSAVAISSATMFFAGADVWKLCLRWMLIVGSVGLALGCGIFTLEMALRANWGVLAGRVGQGGLLTASLGLVVTILEYGREWRDASLRPF